MLPASAARTDLISPDQTEILTRRLYRAVRERLFRLPDELPVLPTHGAGSFCSSSAAGEPWTTVGREREADRLFSLDEDEFVRTFLGGLGSYPHYFLRLREVNRRGPRLQGANWPPLPALPVAEVHRLESRTGATVVDVRAYVEYAAGHVAGSLSIALRGAFASWLGWLVPGGTSLVFVLNPEQDRAELVRQCLNVGYDELLGELEGGVDAWRAAGLPMATVRLVAATAEPAPLTLDVRQRSEYLTAHMVDSMHVELGSLSQLAADLPRAAITAYCGHGERAMTAASLLERAGHRDISVIEGGPDAWQRMGRPVEAGD